VRFLWILPLFIGACRSDPPAGKAAPTASASSSANLDTTPLKGAPTLTTLAGWWIVAEGHKPGNNDPGSQPGSAWWFGPDAIRLLVGDANDRRPITATKIEGDALRLEVEGADLLITRRAEGVALRTDDEGTPVPLRRATIAQVKAFDAADKKRGRMLERACEKALECCNAALAKGIAKDGDCLPLLGKPELGMCIQAVAVYKNKAATAQQTIPECLPDK
jgi:hypothetical protein